MNNRNFLLFILILSSAIMAFAGGPGSGFNSNTNTINDPNVLRWNDLRVSLMSTTAIGSKVPADVRVASNSTQGILVKSFPGGGDTNAETELYGSTQIPHGAAKTVIEPHVHWAPSDNATGTVVWGLEYTIQNVNDNIPATSTIIYAIQDTGMVAKKNKLAEFAPPISMQGVKDSAVIIFRFFRATGHASETYDSSAAYAYEMDFHYQTNTFGSIKEFGDN